MAKQQEISPFSLLIKPASGDCNLRCNYCFYLRSSDVYPQDEKHRMNDEVMEEVVRQLLAMTYPAASFAWQGGEPTLMGLDFYRRAIEAMKKYGKSGVSVSNGFQTNAVALNDDWARFLRKYHFLVGVSLDGPRELHNAHRGDSFDRVMTGIEALKRQRTEFNILSVINSLTAQHPEEIFDFHVSQGFRHLQFIPCMEESEQLQESAPYAVSPEAMGEFLCRLFDVWYARGYPNVHIRMFDNVLEHTLGLQPGTCQMHEKCGTYAVIEYNGDVYPCDFFVYPQWKLGNIMETPLSELVAGEKFNEFAHSKSQLRKRCRKCRWNPPCHGGCSRTRYFRKGSFSDLDYFCKSYQMFYEHAANRFKKLSKDVRTRREEHMRNFSH